MPILLTLKEKENADDYVIRPTVKAVILDSKNHVLLFSDLLLGGGVEEGETFEDALRRECMEEAGIKIDSIEPIGTIIQYRDFIKKKYEVHGFLAHAVDTVINPTTSQKDEIGKEAKWMNLSDAKKILEDKINQLRNGALENVMNDKHQGKLYNSLTTLAFLKEIKV